MLREQATEVALPTEVPLADLLPAILPRFGAERVEEAADHEGYVAQRLGEPPLDEDRTLAELNLLDGETVYLRPRADQLPAIAYDDLVEGVGEQVRAHPGTWEAGHTRWMLRIGAVLTWLAGLVLLAGIGSAVLTAALAGTTALGLLAGGALVARGAENPPVATVLAGCGVGYAALTGWSLVAALAPAAPFPVSLTAAVGLAILALTAGLVAVADAATLFAGALTLAIAIAIPGLIGSVSGLSSHQAAAIGVAVILLAGMFVATTAFRLSGLTLPMLPGAPEQLGEDIEPVPSETVTDRGAATTAYSVALHVGLGLALCLLLPMLALSGSGWQMVLSLVVAFLLCLRARHPNGVAQRWSLIAPAALCVLLNVLHIGGEREPLGLVLAVFLPVLAVAALLVLAGQRLPGRRLVPPWGRAVEIVELLVAIAVVPLLLQVLDVFATVRGLAG